MAHHELLHGEGAPGIKNRQAALELSVPQSLLGLQQPLHHAFAQPEGIPVGAIGRSEAHVGMGLQLPQLRRQRHQWLPGLHDRNRTPGSQVHGGSRKELVS